MLASLGVFTLSIFSLSHCEFTLNWLLEKGKKEISNLDNGNGGDRVVIYGSSTMFVYATRRGVNGFTLDPSIGEFCLSHPDIQCPPSGRIYSVNHGNFFQYSKGVQQYITTCQKKNKSNGGPYTQRYIGSMVADVHRNLIKGGIFMYPGMTDKPGGKLRLLYECNPFAFIIERAGGVDTNGQQRILDIQPTELHQRSPFFVGSKLMMEELDQHLKEYDA